MSQPLTTLAKLSGELRTIEVFDRLHDYATDANPANDHLYATRQVRRKQIMEEIAKLKAPKPEQWKPARLSGAIALICAVGYAMLHYSPR
jgi:hypothetical protein